MTQNSSPEVLLLTPPLMDAVEFPELGMPQLLGWLRHNAVNAAQVDLNQELLTSFLAAEEWRHKVLKGLGNRALRPQPNDLQLLLPTRLPTTEKDGIEAVRRWVERAIDSLALASRDYSIQGVATWATTPHDVYDRYFQKRVIESFHRPRLVGLSLVSPSQIGPAVKLAKRIKQSWPGTLVVVGGPWVIAAERIVDSFLARFPEIDAAVLRRGERPLLELLQALRCAPDGQADLTSVSNLLHQSPTGIQKTAVRPPVALADLPAPDFDGLNVTSYQATMLPVQTNSRCYWGKCLFCYHDSPQTSAGERSPDQVVADIAQIRIQTGVSTFCLADCATPFPWMGRFAAQLATLPSPVTWAAMCRAEPSITPELCEALRASGCAVLMIGLETVSESGLALIRKGITPKDVEHAARCCAGAGIRVHLFLLDFPTNSLADLVQSMEFVLGISDCVEDFTVQRFQLSMLSRLYDQPSLLGIRPLSKEGESLDVFDLPYTADAQTTKEQFFNTASEYRRRFNERKGRVGSPFVVASKDKPNDCGPR